MMELICQWNVCVVLLFVCVCLICPVFGQFGFGNLPDQYYDTCCDNAAPNNYNTVVNASQADEDLTAFITPQYVPTIVYLREDLWSAGSAEGNTYQRQDMSGFGSFWKVVTGMPALYVDLRQTSVSPTLAQLALMGVTAEANKTFTISLTYQNNANGPDQIHAHGILGGWWTDGVPYLTNPLIGVDESYTINYNIDPETNSGTYFIHSHYGFNAIDGMSAPLIIQYTPAGHPLYSILNNPNTVEVLMYVEDWCLVYSNADDAFTAGDNFTDFHSIKDPYICQNPYLAYRAVWGEWNGEKGAEFLGDSFTKNPPPGQGELQQCLEPTLALEYGFSFFFANDRSYDEAQTQYVPAGSYARLRVINAARMTNFLLSVPAELNGVIISLDGSYVKPVNMSSMPTPNQMWVGLANRVDILIQMPANSATTSFAIMVAAEAPAPSESSNPHFQFFEWSGTAGIILYTSPYPPSVNAIPPNVTGVGVLALHPEWLIQQEQMFTPWQASANIDARTAKNYTLNLSGYNGIFGINFKRGIQFPPMVTMDDFLSHFQTVQPLVTMNTGDTICINMTNYNWDTHPMHLHGHKFQVVQIDGIPFSGALHDTVLVPAGRCHSVNICFQAKQQAGRFGLHCHMAIHEMSGMFTTVVYGSGPALQGISSSAASSDNGSSSPSATTVGVSVGLVLGILLLISVVVNVIFLRRYGCANSENLKYAQQTNGRRNDSLSLNNEMGQTK